MQIGWIDFSRGDRDKVLSVLQLFQEKGAIDELGIGLVRDAFSNFFFPGTSTIQTRAKYFFIVSYLLQETAAANKGLEWLWQQEYDCCQRLVARANQLNDSLIGIIGATEVNTKRWIKRKPSSIYWNGIKILGFFNRQYNELSMTEYLRQAELIAKEKELLRKTSRRQIDEGEDADDDITLGASYHKFWEIKPPGGWRDNLTIELTEEEANFFTKLLQKNYPKSVFNLLLEHWPDYDLTFDFEAVTELVYGYSDDFTKAMLVYAKEFDRLVYSARVAYNIILSDGSNQKANQEWAKLVPQLNEIAKIDLKAIFTGLGLNKSETQGFLENLTKIYAQEQPDFNTIRNLLIAREKSLKGARAKLVRPSAENKDWIGGGHLQYRTSNVCQLIKDIKHYV